MKDRKRSYFKRGIFRRSLLVRYEGPGGEVAIPEGVKKIGSHAFSGPECGEITGIVFPASVRFVAEDAFEGCTVLTRLILPDSVTTIGDRILGSFFDTPANIYLENNFPFLREFQADGIPSIEMLDNDWDVGDLGTKEYERFIKNWMKSIPPGGFNQYLIGPLLRNFARRFLSKEKISVKIIRDRMQYLRRQMSDISFYEYTYPNPARFVILKAAVRFADSPELLRLLFQEGLVKPGDISFLMDAADCRGGDAMRALVCECVLRYFPDAEPEELAI